MCSFCHFFGVLDLERVCFLLHISGAVELWLWA